MNYYTNTGVLIHSGKGHDDNPPGRGSGRYPYGSGKDPYQDQRRSGGLKGLIQRRRQKKQQKLELERTKAHLAKLRKEEAEKKAFAANKERLMTNASASEVLKYQRFFKPNELQDIANRLRNLESIQAFSAKERSRKDTFKEVDKFFKKMDYLNSWAGTITSSYARYNQIQSMLDSIYGDKKK